MAIVFMLIRNVTPFLVGLIFIAGIFYTARFFREIHSPRNGIAYFMIPATQIEKLVVGIVMTSIYYLFMMIIVYTAGNLLGTFLNNTLASLDFLKLDGFSFFKHIPLQWKLFEESIFYPSWLSGEGRTSYMGLICRLFLIIQSTFLLGSIYFKNNQAFKTILSVVVIHIALIILLLIEMRIFLGVNSVQIGAVDKDFNTWLKILKNTVHYFYNFLPAFLYAVSFFRLTEKQV